MLIQVIAIIAGIYIAIIDSIGKGILLVIIVIVMHAIITQLSNFLMYLHQKSMKNSELQNMAFMAQIGNANDPVPTAWKIIANICGILFFVSACVVIYVFLAN